MIMSSFADKFPSLAAREQAVVQVDGHSDLPAGIYGFRELYCDEDGCDCRRAIISVGEMTGLQDDLASISYGWETLAYYKMWMRGTPVMRGLKGASLNPLGLQSEYSKACLRLFKELIREPGYEQRIKRHYQLFKASSREVLQLLTVSEMIYDLEYLYSYLPKISLRAAEAQPAEITPELLGALEKFCANPACPRMGPKYTLHMFAMYLLAKFRESRAYPLIIRFARLPGELPVTLGGDLLAVDFPAVLASVCGADSQPIRALIEDPAVHVQVRAAALRALNAMLVNGQLTRTEVVAYHRHLLQDGLERRPAPMWTALVKCAMNVHPGESLADLREAYEKKWVDDTVVPWEAVDRQAHKSVDAVLAYLPRHEPGRIEDVGAAMSRWAGFGGAHTLVGRNEPCPCGSGKKFKKCCGA